MKRAKEQQYALAWARGVADDYKGRHARATEILLEVYGETEEFPATLLAFHGKSWEEWKGQVKCTEHWLKGCPSWTDSCSDREACVMYLEHKLQEDPWWDLRKDLDTVSHRVL